MPIAIPLDGMAAVIAQLRQFAKDAGRDPQSVEVIGSEDQVKNDIEAVKKLGADEIFFVIFQEESIKDLLATTEKFRSFV